MVSGTEGNAKFVLHVVDLLQTKRKAQQIVNKLTEREQMHLCRIYHIFEKKTHL